MKHMVFIVLLMIILRTEAAISVSITQTGTEANSCTRTLTASVSGGSGNYTYTWSIVTPAQAWPTTNNVSVVSLSLNQTVDVNLSVHDVTLNTYGSAALTVYRVLLGSFSTFIPNLITPNGDGFNDTWIITASDKSASPINAYAYSVTIKNSSNVQVCAASSTVTSGHIGIIGGDISWNARLNGVGSIVPTGTYSYSLSVENCTTTTTYTGSLSVMY